LGLAFQLNQIACQSLNSEAVAKPAGIGHRQVGSAAGVGRGGEEDAGVNHGAAGLKREIEARRVHKKRIFLQSVKSDVREHIGELDDSVAVGEFLFQHGLARSLEKKVVANEQNAARKSGAISDLAGSGDGAVVDAALVAEENIIDINVIGRGGKKAQAGADVRVEDVVVNAIAGVEEGLIGVNLHAEADVAFR